MKAPDLVIQTKGLSEQAPATSSRAPTEADQAIRDLSPLKRASLKEVKDDLAIFQIVFSLFDAQQVGYIPEEDVLAVTVSMKKDVQLVTEVYEKIISFRPDDARAGSVSFGEFATLMWEVQQIQQERARAEAGRQDARQGSNLSNLDMDASITDGKIRGGKYQIDKREKKKFEAMRQHLNFQSELDSPLKLRPLDSFDQFQNDGGESPASNKGK